ncbi:hypothetical protein [Planococcus sp. YIM B11945]|uniref:hypothetical protein n=1 Tax=Planococcus sp. YIM B11945 TaxID=3435410 RepID=UPI003D7D1A2C
MKQSFDDQLGDSLKKVDTQLQMDSEQHNLLKKRIVLESRKAPVPLKRKLNKTWLSLAAAIFLLVGFSPFYSTSMASLAAKILPLKISSVENQSGSPEFVNGIMEIVSGNGYEMGGLGILPDPYTIDVSVMAGQGDLKEVKENLQPQIEQYLADQGVDKYKLLISVEKRSEESDFGDPELLANIEKLNLIYKDVLSNLGYPEFAERSGISFSNDTAYIELPDTVKESEEIRSALLTAIQKEKLPIEKVDVQLYNEKEREQNMQWSMIGDEIYNALAGKSAYDVTGYSYGYTGKTGFIEIKTKLSQNTSIDILASIETAIRDYLASDEINTQIAGDGYNIKLLDKNNNSLVKITRTPGEE